MSVIEETQIDLESTIVEIDTLQAHGINAADIARLKGHGIYTIATLNATMKKRLLDIKGFSDTKVDKVKEAAKKMTPYAHTFMTALDLKEMRKRCIRISSGSKQLDSILNGGFQTMSTSEVYGEFRCGKTQLAHTLAVMAQLPKEMGGAEGKVAWIDTEGTFRPERICQIAERFGVDPDQACENISCQRALNSEHQSELLDALYPQLATGEYRLLVLDSFINCFRTDFIGRGELQDRQSKIMLMARKLQSQAEEFNMVIYITNHVQSDPGASALFAGVDGRKPTGGHALAHASTTRLLLRKGRGEERVAKIIDSPDCAEKEAIYIITTGGINDPSAA